MTDLAVSQAATNQTTHFDVLIVGAGISGIGGAYHLLDQCPNKTFTIFETQSDFGGTWRTHTYPGIRSDSDLYTFGYRFKPWTNAPIATAKEILTYMGEVIEENDLDRHQIQHADRVGELVERRQAVDHRGPQYQKPASRRPQRPTSCGCARGTTATPRATPQIGRG
ncbi:MAG: NAD(P)-binding protein [Acidimicrobiales bacterium]